MNLKEKFNTFLRHTHKKIYLVTICSGKIISREEVDSHLAANIVNNESRLICLEDKESIELRIQDKS